MRTLLTILTVAALARPALASGGFEIDEQSAQGVGMGGAQAAVANDPAAIYYNPAGIGFQPGFGALVGGNVVIARTHVMPDNLTLNYAAVAPTVFVAQRLGDHVAIGLGAFSNFAEHFSYPPNWRGRFQGFFVDITTLTLQPTIALRVFSWLSLGVGLDINFASFDIYKALDFGGGEGSVHAGADAIGIGANLGLLVHLVPRYLQLGFTYHSRIDLDFDGHGTITAPSELQSMTGGLQKASTSLPLPHNMSVGLAGFFGNLIVTAELKVSLWRDLQALTLTLTDPATNMTQTQSQFLGFRNTWAVRGGAQYGFLGDKLRVRIGAGYDTSPVTKDVLGPLVPDENRALVSVGVGVNWRWLSVDCGYMAVFLLKTTSTNRDFMATYDSFGQIVSLSATVRLEKVLQHHRVFHTED
jgi:long-chain fatty acid transport protein